MIVSFIFLFAISRFVPKASKNSFHLCRGNTNNKIGWLVVLVLSPAACGNIAAGPASSPSFTTDISKSPDIRDVAMSCDLALQTGTGRKKNHQSLQVWMCLPLRRVWLFSLHITEIDVRAGHYLLWGSDFQISTWAMWIESWRRKFKLHFLDWQVISGDSPQNCIIAKRPDVICVQKRLRLRRESSAALD